MNDLLTDFRHEFRRHKDLAEKAMSQLSDEKFFQWPGKQVNPVALIVKHLAGNLRSRWSDFLTNDGETNRNRDDEFVLGPQDTRSHLMAQWDVGWGALEASLE